MKYIDFCRSNSIFLLWTLFLSSMFSVHMYGFTLSGMERAEIIKNSDMVYVYLGKDVSDIKDIILEISKLDKDKSSVLHLFKQYLRNGFNIGLYDEVIHVLEYAELIIEKKVSEGDNRKIKGVAKRLADIIQKVAHKKLHCDMNSLLLLSHDEKQENTAVNSSFDKATIGVFNENIEIKDDLIVKHNVRIHGSLKEYGRAYFKNKVSFDENVSFDKNVSIGRNLSLGKDLTVGGNITVDGSITVGGSLDVSNLVVASATINSLSSTDAVIENLDVINCVPELCVQNLSVVDGSVSGTLSINDAVIQTLNFPGGIVITNLSLDTLSATDAVITDLTVLSCMDSLCVNDLSVVDQVVISSFNTPGVVHNDQFGNLSTSLVVDADIALNTITNDRLAQASSFNIPGTLVLRDGSGNFITNMITLNGTVINPTDAATKAYVDSVSAGLDPKAPAVVVATTNKVLSGLQTIDGVTLSANNRVLLVGQSFPTQNGLWLAQAGAWTRPADFASGTAAGQAYVLILSGTVNGGSSWLCNTPNAIIDTNPVSFVLFSLPDSTMGANVGVGTGLIFRDKTGNTLNFKSLIAGSNVTISNNASDITLGVNATSANTSNSIVQRNASGNFSAGTITANLIGNASSATNFTGSLAGDVIGTQSATVVNSVGGQTAANVANATVATNNATNLNTPNTIVKRNGIGNFSAGTITATLNGNATSATNFSGVLAGDVTGPQGATVVSFVGGQTAANVAAGTILANAATSANTANTIVRRDASGNFSAGTITATLNGNATSTTNFSGPLAGDVTGTQSATVVSFVGGQTAANVAAGSVLANAATSANAANTIVRRDASGNFFAGTITATLNGTATSTANFTGSLTGDVTGTQTATVVSFVGGQSAANVSAATALANASTSANTANTIVRRNASGNFSAGTITATLNGNSTGFTGSLAGDVTGTQGATVVSFVGGQSAANVATAASLASTATSLNTANTLVLRNGLGNFSAGTITASLNGNASTATTATTATTAINFSGSLSGDVTGTQSATVVSSVGGVAAANVASGANAANAATNLNTVSTIVKRDASGNFSAGTITASLNGNATTATTATNFSGPLAGNVTGTQGATVVSFVGGQTAANVASATIAANAATNVNTFNTIVKRDGGGNFSAQNVSMVNALVSGFISLPTTASITVGTIQQNGISFIHSFGTGNTFVGQSAGNFTMTGTGLNVAIGTGAGSAITTGNKNVIIGSGVGTATTTGLNNIYIDGNGLTPAATESNTIRIGNTQTSCFIQGIFGATSAVGLAVLVNASGQLGTILSTRNVKHDIAPMKDKSAIIYDLNPVTFVYNNDEEEHQQYGLIAEEVEEVLPELVVRAKDGSPLSVRYEVLPVLLLNELQKQQITIQDLENQVNEMRQMIEKNNILVQHLMTMIFPA